MRHNRKRWLRNGVIGKACLVIVVCGLLPTSSARAAEPDWKAQFLRLCDANSNLVEKQARAAERDGKRVFYWDSYVVRALCVAYDMTKKQEYLDACKLWSDRMIAFQSGMDPKGAYFMQYGRKPGEHEGSWFVADCASIALGVLATGVRCTDPVEKAKYLSSVKSYAQLVIDNYVRPSGGVTDGLWKESDEEWWCSTGIFGSLAFHLYTETGDKSYLKFGLGAIDWLNKQDLETVAVHFPPDITPTVMFYCMEGYSASLPYLTPGTERYEKAMVQIDKTFRWSIQRQLGRGKIDYATQWGSKFAGMPFHMYVYADHVPGNEALVQAADKELAYVAGILQQTPASQQRDQLALFLMMCYAEKVSPGSIDRGSKGPVGEQGTPSTR